MSDITQEYAVNVPFNAYTSVEIMEKAAEISTGDWTWNERTLLGFKKEDKTFVPFGSEILFDSDNANMSGVWALNKSSHDLSIFGLGLNGRLNVEFIEQNPLPPLGDYNHPYLSSRNYILDSSNSAIIINNIYWSHEYNAKLTLSVKLSCEPRTTIKKIACKRTSGTITEQISGFNDENLMSCIQWDNTGMHFYFPNHATYVPNGEIHKYGLSIDFFEGGILTYHSNKVRKTMGHSDTRFTLQDGTVESYEINGALDLTWLINNEFCDINHNWLKNIKSIDIGNTVDIIEDYSFHNCDELESVIIPGSVEIIGENAFQSCNNLKNVLIDNGVKSIKDNAFYSCSSLSSISIPDSIINIGHTAFEKCNAALFDTTTINGLTLVDRWVISSDYNQMIDNLELSGVRGVCNEAFFGSYDLTSVVISNDVITLGKSAFENCWSLSNVTIGESVSNIGIRAFRGCLDLTNVIMNNGVKNIGNWAFTECNLYEVEIPSSVIYIGEEAFSNNYNLSSMTFNNKTMNQVKEMDNYHWNFSGTIHCSDGDIIVP